MVKEMAASLLPISYLQSTHSKLWGTGRVTNAKNPLHTIATCTYITCKTESTRPMMAAIIRGI